MTFRSKHTPLLYDKKSCVICLSSANMELIKVYLICLLITSVTAGQEGEDGLLDILMEVIKTEVSNQMKIERKTLKEEILKEIQDDREKHEGIRKELESTREGKSVKISIVRIVPIRLRVHLSVQHLPVCLCFHVNLTPVSKITSMLKSDYISYSLLQFRLSYRMA